MKKICYTKPHKPRVYAAWCVSWNRRKRKKWLGDEIMVQAERFFDTMVEIKDELQKQ